MASFLSILSLFVLVFFNGCFTVPIFDEQTSSSTFLPLNENSTDQSQFDTRSFSINETSSPLLDNEYMGFNISTSVYNSTEEQTDQSSRGLAEILTSSPLTLPNEESSSTTINPGQHSHHHKRHHDEISSTTIESTTDFFPRALRGLEAESDNETDIQHGERDMQVELTTDSIFLSTSTSSLGIQQFSTSQPSTTQKYVGHLKDKTEQPDQDQDQEHDDKPHPHPHPHPEHNHEHEDEDKPHPHPHSHPEHKPEDIEQPSKVKGGSEIEFQEWGNSTEGSAPIAVFDQEASKQISYPLDNALVLDENNSLIVTDIPQKFSTSTIKISPEETTLNQGSTLILFLLAALLFSACVMASTLAFVKNRYTLKRKSRITEMEAHLDENYQHYPHPFMFQSHYQK